MRSLVIAGVLGAAAIAVPNAGVARMSPQWEHQEPMVPMGTRIVNPHDPHGAIAKAGQVRAEADDRQKKIAADTAKLLELATELKTDVDKTSKDQMSLDVIRKADEIEKLAHDLKLRMKG